MATSALATAFVNIVPGTVAVENYLKGELGVQAEAAGVLGGGRAAKGLGGGFASKIKGYLGPALATMVGAFAAVQIKDFLSDAITKASDFNEQGSAVGQVFGKAASAIQDFAAKGASSLGQNKIQILDAAKSFGIYGQAAGLAGEGNAKFSTDLVKLATDLASFNNTSVDEAIQALGAGLRGESEPLRRYGVLLDDATLKAKALTMGLYNGKGNLDQHTKILAANAVIMDQTKTQQGDFERTSAGLANQQRILAAQFDNVKTQLGQFLLPTMGTITTFMTTNVMPAFKQFFQDFKDGKTPLNDFINSIKTVYTWVVQNKDVLAPLAVAVLAGVAAFKAWTGAIALYNGIMKIAAAVQMAFNLVMAANPIMLVVVAVAALVAGLIYFFTQTKTGQKIWAGFVGFLQDTGKNVVKAWDAVVKWFGDFPNQIGKFFSNAGKWLMDAGKNIIDGLINGLKNGMSFLGNAVKGVADSVIKGFKNLLGIHSPSKVFHEFGKNIVQGLNEGLVGEKANVQDTMQKVSNWLISAFDSKKISASQEKAGLALVKAFSGPLSQFQAQYQTTLDALDKAQQNLQNKLEERANYVTSLAAKFGGALDIQAPTADNAGTTAADAIKQLQERIAKTEELQKATDTLLKMGLDKSLYKQIVEAGSVDFAKSIIAGGSEAVKQLNVLSSQADKQALDLASKVGDTLFGQGIKFAESVVKGLEDKKKDLEDLMGSVAKAFETAISNVVANSKTDIKKSLTDAKSFLDGAVASAQAQINAAKLPAPAMDSVERRAANPIQTVVYNAAPNESLTSEQQLVQAVQRVGRIL